MIADPRPAKRIKDPELLEQFRSEHRGMDCESCGKEPGRDPHHVWLKSQGGGDVWENLRWVGVRCHGALHGNPWVDGDGIRWDAARVRESLASSRTDPRAWL